MKIKHIVIFLIITVAYLGFLFLSHESFAKSDNKPTVHNEEHTSLEHNDQADHGMEEEIGSPQETETGHQDHDHEAPEALNVHDGHSGHGHEGLVDLMTPAQAEEAGLVTETIQPGAISGQIKLTGEVRFNQDRIIHLVPRIAGVVAAVNNKLGDHVSAGDVLAVIHSRELTDIKSEYLSALERIENAKVNFEREAALWEKKIISERQYLESKEAYVETRIALRAAERKLHALGFSEQYIAGLADQSHETLFEYRLTAPSDGVIIEKHIVQGELVTSESAVFIIADTTSFWVDLQVYPRDLAAIKTGQKVMIMSQDERHRAEGLIAYLSPVIDRETRTALARVALSAEDGEWRAGMFAAAHVTPGRDYGGHTFVVPKSAIQTIDERPVLFIVSPEGYEPVAVKTGRSNKTHVEILSGVSAGQTYVSDGTFELKAKMVTSTMGGHAGHGH